MLENEGEPTSRSLLRVFASSTNPESEAPHFLSKPSSPTPIPFLGFLHKELAWRKRNQGADLVASHRSDEPLNLESIDQIHSSVKQHGESQAACPRVDLSQNGTNERNRQHISFGTVPIMKNTE
mmetsp:Transcript_17007/g.35148  ORF Transcript_17007/g.35148 Transcript_17007/m.35148 type:complete len:124 (-) Transcript_17007:1396-1767(-)